MPAELETFDFKKTGNGTQPIITPFAQCFQFISLKTTETQRFPCVFREYKMGIMGSNGLSKSYMG